MSFAAAGADWSTAFDREWRSDVRALTVPLHGPERRIAVWMT